MSFFKVFKGKDVHVRISPRGHQVLNDSKLAMEVANTILQNKEDLQQGKAVHVDSNKHISIGFVTTISGVKP